MAHEAIARRPAATPCARRILVVDDSFLMRRVIRDIVARDPTLEIVGEAGDGIDALRKTAELEPDLVLLDIEMPRMDGIEFLRRARIATAARVIVISSIAQPGSPHAERALELGVDDILPKPSGVLSMDLGERRSRELLDAIHRCLPDRTGMPA